MSDNTAIEWTDATWNPITGCTKVSPGCDHCYAEIFAERWRGTPGHHFENGFDLILRPGRLDQPLRWKRPRLIFVNSMSDLFHPAVPTEFIARVFAVMAASPQHIYQVLTKRHGRMRSLLRDECQCGSGHAPGVHFRSAMEWAATPHSPTYVAGLEPGLYHRMQWPLPNVWLGVSVEDRAWAEVRVHALLTTPAAVRWLSCEPLLGPINLEQAGGHLVDWVVAGGESGPGARPMHPDWARSLRDQCKAEGVPFFFKQWGEWAPAADLDPGLREHAREELAGGEYVCRVGKKRAGRLLDGVAWDQYPAVHHG